MTLFAWGSEILAQTNNENTFVHTVKKGETIYGISKQYNLPLEIIYKLNPDSQKGVKKGDRLMLPSSVIEDNFKNKSQKSSLEPNTAESETIYPNNSTFQNSQQLKEKDVTSLISNESKNENKSQKKKGGKNNIKEEINIDETSSENIDDNNKDIIERKDRIDLNSDIIISEENISLLMPEDSTINVTYDESVKIALLLDDPNSKKDIDFTRGMLTRIDGYKNDSYVIDLKIIDGRISSGDIITDLDGFEPDVIITTADKTFPLFLADYGNTNNVYVVNVFDLKNDLYEDNPSIIQILPPSSFFNTKIAQKLFKDNNKSKLLMVGEEDENDGIANELLDLFGDNCEIMSLEEFGGFEPDYDQSVMIYSYASKKEEVADFLNNMENIISNYPGLDYKLIGRPNWIALLDDYEDRFKEYSVYIPSRVWIDEEEKDWKIFYKSFEELFGGIPIRSIPNFAASGYDMANFFIPFVAENKGREGRIKLESQIYPGLQNSIKLKKEIDGGYLNNLGYIIKFRSSGFYDKIIVD